MDAAAIRGREVDRQRLKTLSQARMTTYLNATNRHAGRALSLYKWNQDLSSAFWPLISLTEVTLRNRLDSQIGAFCAKHGGIRNWLLSPESLPKTIKDEFGGLIAGFKGKANDAKKLRDGGGGLLALQPHPRANAPLTNDDVLAQITLGQWLHFIPGLVDEPDETTYQRRLDLWKNVVGSAFKNVNDPLDMYYPLRRAHQFRNRVAHHEPVFNLELKDQRNDLLTILAATSQEIKEWYLGGDPIPQILNNDPRNRSSRNDMVMKTASRRPATMRDGGR